MTCDDDYPDEPANGTETDGVNGSSLDEQLCLLLLLTTYCTTYRTY